MTNDLRVLVVTYINNLYRAFPNDYVAYSLAKNLKRLGVESLVASLYNFGSFLITRTYVSAPLRYLSLFSWYTNLKFLKSFENVRLKKLVSTFNPDIIISTCESVSLAKLAKRRGKKLVFWSLHTPFHPLIKVFRKEHIEMIEKCDFVFV